MSENLRGLDAARLSKEEVLANHLPEPFAFSNPITVGVFLGGVGIGMSVSVSIRVGVSVGMGLSVGVGMGQAMVLL